MRDGTRTTSATGNDGAVERSKKTKRSFAMKKKKVKDSYYTPFKMSGQIYKDKFLSGYISFVPRKKRKSARTKEIMPEVFVDFDKNGNVIGVEILRLKDLQPAIKKALKLAAKANK